MVSNKRTKRSQRGMALIVALLTLLLISAITLGMVAMSNSENSISGNFRDEQIALSAARGGQEEIRDRMRVSAADSLTASLPTALPGSTGGIVYITNPAAGETVAPWTAGSKYADTEICKELTCVNGVPGGTPWYTSASASATYAASPILYWKWVRIAVKTNLTTYSVNGASNGNRVCWNGKNEVVVAAGVTCVQANPAYQPVYTLTSLAVTASGSRRTVTSEVKTDAFPSPPGAMVFDGPNPTYGAPSSAAFNVNGNDAAQGPNAGAGCGAASNEPAVGGYNAGGVATLVGDVGKRSSSYTGTGGTPSVQDVSAPLGTLSTVDGLQNLVNTLTSAADSANIYVGNTASLTNPGTDASPVINVVQGDLTIAGGLTGTGILLVTGTLTMKGNPSYNGVIFVIGKGDFEKSGGGNGTLNGSILVANMYDASNNPIALGANNPPGTPTINWNGGGNATIQYDSCWINYVTQSFPYSIVAQREVVF